MATGDITSIRLESDFGQIGSVNYFCYLSLTDDPTWEGRIVDQWIDEVLPFFCAMLSPDVVVSQMEIHPIIPVGGSIVFRNVIPNQVGGLGGAAASGQVAAKVTWYPDGSHRSQRGRTFIGGVANDMLDSSRRVGGDLDTTMRAWASKMMELWGPDGTEGTARFSILSRSIDGALRPVPVALPVMAWAVQSILGSQRRRLL